MIKVRYSSLRHSFFRISFNQISQNWAFLLIVFVITFNDVHMVSFVQMMVFYEAFIFRFFLNLFIVLIINVDHVLFRIVIYLNGHQQYFFIQLFSQRNHDVVVQKVMASCSSWIRSFSMISYH